MIISNHNKFCISSNFNFNSNGNFQFGRDSEFLDDAR